MDTSKFSLQMNREETAMFYMGADFSIASYFSTPMSATSIEFDFVTDDEAKDYCIEVVEQMMKLFNISQQEAVGRVNRAFVGEKLVGSCEDLWWLYHEIPEDEARFIYYEPGTYWWVEGSPLIPKPFP